MLLMARLGLRPGEVVAMTLDDLDWETGALLVRGKGGRRDRLPLPQDVGQAVVTYLSTVRPRCAARRVFLRMKAPSVASPTRSLSVRLGGARWSAPDLNSRVRGPTSSGTRWRPISCTPGHPWRPSVTCCGTAAPRRQIYAKVDQTAQGRLPSPGQEVRYESLTHRPHRVPRTPARAGVKVQTPGSPCGSSSTVPKGRVPSGSPRISPYAGRPNRRASSLPIGRHA